MTDRQLNNLSMIAVVKAFMALNILKWTNKPKIVAVMAKIDEAEADILEAAGIQSNSAKGATISEKDLGLIAASKTEHVDNGLKAYYDELKDSTNFGLINFTISDFLYGRKKEIIVRMRKVWAQADGLDAGELDDFEVTDLEISGLKTIIDSYEEAVPGHDVIVATTSAATEELPGLFKILRGFVRTLDLLMGTQKASQLTFYDGYLNARGIKDLGKTIQAEELTLVGQQFKAIFGNKIEIGYWITVRNHSDYPATVYLTDKKDVLEVLNEVIVGAHSDLKLELPEDFNDVMGHYVMVYNGNKQDDVSVTIILSKGKSQSSAEEVITKAK